MRISNEFRKFSDHEFLTGLASYIWFHIFILRLAYRKSTGMGRLLGVLVDIGKLSELWCITFFYNRVPTRRTIKSSLCAASVQLANLVHCLRGHVNIEKFMHTTPAVLHCIGVGESWCSVAKFLLFAHYCQPRAGVQIGCRKSPIGSQFTPTEFEVAVLSL